MRVPAIAVSPWIPERTVINAEYRNTSVLQTVRGRWDLGAPLTARDATARDIAPVLTLATPRPPEEWPDAVPRPVPAFQSQLLAPGTPLTAVPRAAVFAVLELSKCLGLRMPDLDHEADLLRAEGIAIVTDLCGGLFPNLHPR